MKFNHMLLAALILWVVGDIVTTAIGFSMGRHEINPFFRTANIYEISALKVIVATIIYQIYQYKSMQASEIKWVGLSWIWLVGMLILINNIHIIVYNKW